jgi:hypothetical protein
VRGIGVAESVRTSTFVFIFLHLLLVLHPEALFLVDDQQAEILELHVVARAGGGYRSRNRPHRS